MAYLHNDTRSLRFHLTWVDQETVPPFRLVGTVAMEYYDRRDKEFWPLVRLPVVYAEGDEVARFNTQIKLVCRGELQGFSQTLGARSELAFQVGEQGGDLLVEVGMDLAPYLQETAGAPHPMGRNLSLYRFSTSMASLVEFGAGQVLTKMRSPQ